MNIWHPMSIQGNSSPIKIRRAEGDFLYRENGEAIIDAISSWWTVIHGHRHPAIMEAIRKQTERLDHVIFAGFTHEPAEELAQLILDSMNADLDSGHFSKVFFSDNGSNAVEIAVKIAHQFYKNRGTIRDKKKSIFVRFSLSYHGDSIGAMSVGGESVFTRIFRELSFPTKEFPSPNCIRCPWGKIPDTCSTECLDDFRSFSTDHEEEITAVLVEPLVSGANGMVFHSEKFLQELRRITKEKNIFLILDEVFTGLYRTGEWYAFAKARIQPDIVCLAKGLTGGTLPLAVTVVTEEIYREFDTADPLKAFYHGHTMTGNPLACSAAVASLGILKEQGRDLIGKLEENLRSRGEMLASALPNLVRDMRVLGGILAFEVEQDLGPDEYLNPLGRRIREACLERGVLIRPLGNTVYLTPSYHIGQDSLDQIFSVLRDVLE
ncbi:MAG: adenosylmethionine--8-amino-7-oxononanoate transaminase [Leptospira sp.]|nr:adenosylmethionine--8-amino-7-oxononanoate transaminase [Leptospira sp.]